MSAETRVLLIAAPFYEDITEQLVAATDRIRDTGSPVLAAG